MAHDFEMGLLGQIFLEAVEGAAVDVHHFVAAQANQMMGMAEGVQQEPVFPALGQQDLFRQFLFRETFQDPVHRGKIQGGPCLEQFLVDFIGTEHFPLVQEHGQHLEAGLGAFQPGPANQLPGIQGGSLLIHGAPAVSGSGTGTAAPAGAARRKRWR